MILCLTADDGPERTSSELAVRTNQRDIASMDLLKLLAVTGLFLTALSAWFFLPLWAVKYAGRALRAGQTSKSRWTNAGYSFLCAVGVAFATYVALAAAITMVFPTPIP